MMRYLKLLVAGLCTGFFVPAFGACIPSGVTDQYIYFVAVDSTDFTTRETGLTTFTVYRSRDGGAAAAFTTPTINETDGTNMPGVYELLLDEDMTIAAGNDVEEMAFHITQASMAPVTRTIELCRPKITAGNTLGVASDGDLLEVNTLTGHTAQTGDSFARIGTAGAGLSNINLPNQTMDIVGNITGNLSGSVGSVTGNVGGIAGTINDFDALDTALDTAHGAGSWATGAGGTGLTAIASGTAQSATSTTLVMASGETFANDELIGAVVQITGGSTGVGQSRCITDNVGSTDTLTVGTWTTTPTGTITYEIAPSLGGECPLSTGSATTLNVTASGNVGIDWANVENPTSTVGLTNTTVGTTTTNTDMLTGAAVNAQVDTALADIHLDHLLAADYDPASPPGVSTALLNELIESDAGVSRFTVNALENGPSGSGASAATIADAVWTEAIADHSGTAGSTAEALNSASAGGGLDAAGVRAAVGLASANLDTQLSTAQSDLDTITGTNGVTLASTQANYAPATAAALATVDSIVDSILVDTAEIGTAGAGLTNINLPNQTMDIVGNITGNLSGSVGSLTGHTVQTGDSYARLGSPSGASVSADLLTLINSLGITEPASVPNFSSDAGDVISWLLALSRNEINQTSTTKTIRNDADTGNIATCSVSDDGTTFTRAECN